MKSQLIKIILLVFTINLITINIAPNQADAGIAARSAILMEQESGRVLFEKNAHVPMRIASITKIMTAILAIESGKMNETVKVSSKAARAEGSSLYLQAGDKIKLNDLVHGLMLRSGNDAAVAIAEHVGGSLDGFVKMMNDKAKSIGMDRTIFSNPHGLDDHENHYSTSYDMALLTQYAMKNETYARISGTKSYQYKTADGRVKQVWHNKNRLLTQLYAHSTGGKTGYTIRAKRTLVSTAKKNGMELIVVTINDPNDWKDHISLFEYAYSKYKLLNILSKDQPIVTDDIYPLFVKEDFAYPVTKAEEKALTLKIHQDASREVGVNESKAVGKVEILLNEKPVGDVELYPADIPKFPKKSWWQKLKDRF